MASCALNDLNALRGSDNSVVCSPSFHSDEDNSLVEDIQNRPQSSQEWTSHQIQPKIRPCDAQRNGRQPQNITGDTGDSVNILHNQVHDRTVTQIWDKYGMFGRLARRKPLLLKQQQQHDNTV